MEERPERPERPENTDVVSKLALIYGLTVSCTPVSHGPISMFLLQGHIERAFVFVGVLTLVFFVLAFVSVRRIRRSRGALDGVYWVVVGALCVAAQWAFVIYLVASRP